MTGLRTLLLTLALLAFAGVAQAQAQSLALSSAMVTFPNAGVAQLNARGVEDAGINILIDPGGSSTGWTLSLRAGGATLSPGGKPISDIHWRLEGTTIWTALGTTDQSIASGVGPTTVKVYLRATLRWAADGPGSYGTDVTYSLTTS